MEPILEDKILNVLKTKGDYISTLGIAKETMGEQGTTKDVNPTLYSLLSRKRVIKMCDDKGRNPHWKLNTSPELLEREEIERKLEQFFVGKEPGSSASTIELVDAIQIPKKSLNPVLYSLTKRKKLEKQTSAASKVPSWTWIAK